MRRIETREERHAAAGWYWLRVWLWVALICAGTGCASPRPIEYQARPFVFGRDSFAYDNELQWVYYHDAQGKWTHRRNEPKPDYTHHCFVVARAAKQFFLNARFDPALPVADEATYRRQVREVMASDPRNAAAPADQVVIPGYANLYDFSRAQERVLKEECGSTWQSYFQRGHWRMVFPFSAHNQEEMAEQLRLSVRANRPAVVHIACFPSLTINHALLLFDARESPGEIEFAAYDPNDAAQPTRLVFDRERRRFRFPQTRYFEGGEVSVYEVYVSRCY